MQRTGRYDVARMQDDMAALGFQPVDVARRCRPPISPSTLTRFLKGTHQTARVAKRIARVLKHTVEDYLIRSSEAA